METLIDKISRSDGATLNALWFDNGAIRTFIQTIDPPSEFKFKAAIFTNTVESDHDIDVFLAARDVGADAGAVALLTNAPPLLQLGEGITIAQARTRVRTHAPDETTRGLDTPPLIGHPWLPPMAHPPLLRRG